MKKLFRPLARLLVLLLLAALTSACCWDGHWHHCYTFCAPRCR